MPVEFMEDIYFLYACSKLYYEQSEHIYWKVSYAILSKPIGEQISKLSKCIPYTKDYKDSLLMLGTHDNTLMDTERNARVRQLN